MLLRHQRLSLLIVAFLLLSSCAGVEKPETQRAKNFESNEESQQYQICFAEQGLRTSDFDTVYSLCTDFLNDYYTTISNENEMDPTKYIENENLLFYTHKVIERSTLISTSKLQKATFGLIDIQWHEEQQYVFLDLSAVILMDYGGGYGESHQFLVKNQDNKLIIVDWYSPGKAGSAIFDLYRKQRGIINDPTIWENVEWVNGFFQRANIVP